LLHQDASLVVAFIGTGLRCGGIMIEGAMRLKSFLAMIAAAVVVWAAWPTDADAQSRRRSGARVAAVDQDGRIIRRGNRTRVTVRRSRSFLDPGTEVLPGSQNYTNYALPPLGGPDRAYDPTGARRFPLPDSYELPGYTRY
jgi:hypothetical protein